MKTIINTLLFVTVMVLLMVHPAAAQVKRSQDADLLRLKIEELEKVDIKSKSSTVQDIYLRSLLRLYDQYESVLEGDISDLEKIKAATSAPGDGESEAAVQIRKLMRERDITAEKIKTLKDGAHAASSPADAGRRQSGADTAATVRPATYTEEPSSRTASRVTETQVPEASRVRSVLASPNAVAAGAPAAPLPPAGDDTRAAGGPGNTPDPNAMEIDWPTRTAGCPPKVTQSSTRTKVHVTDVNDVIIDFSSGARLEYRMQAKGTPVSVAPEIPLTLPGNKGGFALPACTTHDQLNAMLTRIRQFVQGNPYISPHQPGGISIPLATTLHAAEGDGDVDQIRTWLKAGTCTIETLSTITDAENIPVLEWIGRLDGPHTYDFNIVLEPGQNYEFTLREYWMGAETRGGIVHRNCGENDVFTLSIGSIVSTLPQRTYSHQKALVPPGSSTTQDVLTVGNSRNISVLGAALLNYHFPRFGSVPNWLGLTLSAGPVYTLGDTPGVSPLGLFVGTSLHLNRSIFITPGVHIGQFADFPTGFAPGTVIPNQFGDLNPVKRTTAHFAFGLTYRTKSFKKSSDTEGAAGSSIATAGGSGSGSAGSGGSGSGNSNKPPKP